MSSLRAETEWLGDRLGLRHDRGNRLAGESLESPLRQSAREREIGDVVTRLGPTNRHPDTRDNLEDLVIDNPPCDEAASLLEDVDSAR